MRACHIGVVYISPMEKTLTPARRREFRAAAHHLHPVVAIGQHGLTPAVLHEIDIALAAHELIKVRVFNDDRAERDALFARVCEELDAVAVQHLGKLLILWREKPAAEKAPGRAGTGAEPRPAKRGKAKGKPPAGKPAGKPGAKKPRAGQAATPKARTIPAPGGRRTGGQWSAAAAAAKRGPAGSGTGRTTAGTGVKRSSAGTGAKRTTAHTGAKRTPTAPGGKRTTTGVGTRRTGAGSGPAAAPAAGRRRRAKA